MKKTLAILSIFSLMIYCSNIDYEQNNKSRLANSIIYEESFDNFANPERGLQKYSATSSTNINALRTTVPYNLLSTSTLNSWRNSTDRVTVVYRYFMLPSGSIPQSYLTNMQTDFNAIRNAGMSVIVRFAYTNQIGTTAQQPTKSRIIRQIQQLSSVVNSNSDVILSVQCGFIGTWGEWYYTNSTEFGTNGTVSTTQWNNRRDVVNAMLTNFQSVFLQVRYAQAMRVMFPNGNSRIGFYNDAFLNEWGDMGTYSTSSRCNNPQGTNDYNYIANITRNTPMTGESNGISACSPLRSIGANAIKELDDLNFTTLNRDYYLPMWNGWIASGHYNEIVRRLGYRFVITEASFTPTTYSITIKNVGFANILKRKKVFLVYGNGVQQELSTDIRNWSGTTTISGNTTQNPTIGQLSIFIEGNILFANVNRNRLL